LKFANRENLNIYDMTPIYLYHILNFHTKKDYFGFLFICIFNYPPIKIGTVVCFLTNVEKCKNDA
jgi:hypothetical protein